jgi:tetratricopeptide (TPR) repeat protein
VGCALEKVYANSIDEHLGELAYHFLEGGDKDKALDYFLKAGEKAAKIYANGEAVSYFQSALDLLEDKEGGFRKKACVLEKLGDLKKLLGKYDAGIKSWNDALLRWTQLNENKTAATLHRKMANVLWSNLGDSEKAKEHQGKALKILEAEPESVELASLYEDIADRISMGLTGDMAEARFWAEKALELGKKLNAHEVIARSYYCLGGILDWLGEAKKGLECQEKALRIALDNGYVDVALLAYNDLGARSEGYERTLEYYEKGYELAKKVGDISSQSWLGLSLSYRYAMMGDMGKALSLLEETAALDKKAGHIAHLTFSLNGLALASLLLGDWDKSEQYCKEALGNAQKLDDFQSIASCHSMHGRLYFEKGEPAKAREFYEKQNEVYEKHGARSSQMNASQNLIRTYIELGEIEKANNLIDNLAKYALEVDDKGLVAAADVLKAIQLRAQKKWEESIEYFERGRQEFEALGARRWDIYYFAKMVLLEYAQMYLERDQEGDREKAYSLLDQALEIFQKMGAKKDIGKIIAKKKLLTA